MPARLNGHPDARTEELFVIGACSTREAQCHAIIEDMKA